MVGRSAPRVSGNKNRGGLGPQARGIFDRLFGVNDSRLTDGARSAPASTRGRREGVSIAVASGKGGTGKSFLATNTGVLLHQLGANVTIVDCDYGMACDHLLLGVSPRTTLQDYVCGRAEVDDVLVSTPAGPTLLSGVQGVRRMASLADHEMLRLAAMFGRVAENCDVMILDAGAGISPQTVLTLLCADHILLVTEPEIAALTDAYAVIKCVGQLRPSLPFSIVVNRVTGAGQGVRAFDKLAEVADRYTGVTPAYLGEIGADPAVTRRRLGELPVSWADPRCETTRALRSVLRELEKVVGAFEPRTVQPGHGIEERFRQHRLFIS